MKKEKRYNISIHKDIIEKSYSIYIWDNNICCGGFLYHRKKTDHGFYIHINDFKYLSWAKRSLNSYVKNMSPELYTINKDIKIVTI